MSCHPILCRETLDHRLIIQTVLLQPSGAVWTDDASNVSRPVPSGADQIDAEHQAPDRAGASCRGGGPLAPRAASPVCVRRGRRPTEASSYQVRVVWNEPLRPRGRSPRGRNPDQAECAPSLVSGPKEDLKVEGAAPGGAGDHPLALLIAARAVCRVLRPHEPANRLQPGRSGTLRHHAGVPKPIPRLAQTAPGANCTSGDGAALPKIGPVLAHDCRGPRGGSGLKNAPGPPRTPSSSPIRECPNLRGSTGRLLCRAGGPIAGKGHPRRARSAPCPAREEREARSLPAGPSSTGTTAAVRAVPARQDEHARAQQPNQGGG